MEAHQTWQRALPSSLQERGGTSLTSAGEPALKHYRKLDAALQRRVQAHGAELLALIGPVDEVW